MALPSYNKQTGAPCTEAVAVDVSGGNQALTDAVNSSRGGAILYVGVSGNVQVVTAGGDTVTYVAVPAGTFMPILVTEVRQAGTTATSIVANW